MEPTFYESGLHTFHSETAYGLGPISNAVLICSCLDLQKGAGLGLCFGWSRMPEESEEEASSWSGSVLK